MVESIALHTRLKPGTEEAYADAHAHIPAELVTALKEAGVQAELHVYPLGGHAFGLRPTAEPITRWPALVDTWMESIGMLPSSGK